MALGAHLSIAGGLDQALERASRIGCTCVQIFTRSNRQWAARPLSDDDRARLDAARARTGIGPIVVHAAYLINLAATDRTVWRRSFASWKTELERCGFLGLDRVVLHPGSPGPGGDEPAALQRVARSLDRAFEATGGGVRVLLELTAGQGGQLGWRLEHLRELIDRSRYPEKLGACFDTCHAHAAGHDLTSKHKYYKMMQRFDQVVGLDTIGCFHINDAARPLGSRVDRHAPIGEGTMGLEPFRRLLRDRRFRGLPMVLETPGGEPAWQRELALLRGLRNK